MYRSVQGWPFDSSLQVTVAADADAAGARGVAGATSIAVTRTLAPAKAMAPPRRATQPMYRRGALTAIVNRYVNGCGSRRRARSAVRRTLEPAAAGDRLHARVAAGVHRAAGGEQGSSLPAIHRHVVALEEAGLVERRKSGRTTYLALTRAGMLTVQRWLDQFHAFWGTPQETLENYIAAIAAHPNTEKDTE